MPIIARQYAQSISLEDLAQQLHLTSEYFSYLFHRNMGISLSGYLRNYRIAVACQLFCDAQSKIYEVAEKVGYPDAKYFCRAFRDVTGMTPSEYLRKYRDQDQALPQSGHIP